MKNHAQLDARPDRLDLRDRTYRPPLVNLPPQFPDDEVVQRALREYIEQDRILDQGEEGACTGFGLACVINYLFWVRARQVGEELPPKVSEAMLYDLARFYDEWPGEDYEGSSCRGGMKAWHKHGVCAQELWPPQAAEPSPRRKKRSGRSAESAVDWADDAATRPLGVYYRIRRNSVVDVQAAIHEVGAVYASAEVHDGWDVPYKKGGLTHARLVGIRKAPRGGDTSGHAFALVGYNRRGFIVQNSWGTEWGSSGFAVLPYDDWVKNAMDAWVAVLGAPTEGKRARSPRVFVPSRSRYSEESEPSRAEFFGWFRRGEETPARRRGPERWGVEKAYHRTVVAGNNGHVINRIVGCRDGADSVQCVAQAEALQFFANQRGRAGKLVIYAHGGLNDENDSLDRIRSLGPWFEANGIYPLFVTWKTGTWESIRGILADRAANLFSRSEGVLDALRGARDRVREKLDRSIEVVAENGGVKSLWSEMKQNAAASVLVGRVGWMVLQRLHELRTALREQQNKELEIHLVGHSAGSIVLGEWLRLDAPEGRRSRNQMGHSPLQFASGTLYAPACSVSFALETWAKAVDRNALAKRDLHVHLLSDRRELDDTVGPYGKSLLYLVSRALESYHKTPLLGLERVFTDRPDTPKTWHDATRSDVAAWQRFWRGRDGRLHVVDAAEVRNSTSTRIDAAHGSFDNDIDVVQATLKRILGRAPRVRVSDLRY